MDHVGSILLMLRPWMDYDYIFIEVVCWVEFPEQRRLCTIHGTGLGHYMRGVFQVVSGCDCVIVCYTLHGKHIHSRMYMGNVIAWLLRRKLYAWHNVYRKKKWNAKVRNHNIRGSENEMNTKVLNFIEINKNKWLAISTTKGKGDERVSSWL